MCTKCILTTRGKPYIERLREGGKLLLGLLCSLFIFFTVEDELRLGLPWLAAVRDAEDCLREGGIISNSARQSRDFFYCFGSRGSAPVASLGISRGARGGRIGSGWRWFAGSSCTVRSGVLTWRGRFSGTVSLLCSPLPSWSRGLYVP